jgi:hypothetical protein
MSRPLFQRRLQVALSDEARRRFSFYVDATDPSNTNPDDDTKLMEFVAWALVNDREALSEQFALQSMMSQRDLTDEKTRYVQTILRAAPHVVDAIDRERAIRQPTTRRGEDTLSSSDVSDGHVEGVPQSDAAREVRDADDVASAREADEELGGEA